MHESDQDQDTDLENDRLDPTPARDCGRFTWWTQYQPKIWPILEEPHSSKAAKVRPEILRLLVFHSSHNFCYCFERPFWDIVYLGVSYIETNFLHPDPL